MRSHDFISKAKRPSCLVCGVAAMMADKFAWSCFWTRVVWVVAVILNPAVSLFVYFALALILPKEDPHY